MTVTWRIEETKKQPQMEMPAKRVAPQMRVLTAITSTNLVPLETSRSAVEAPERPSTGSQPGDELAPKDDSRQ
ncbi:hypothetical protein LAZ67_22001186 [Cordylochernes scorpioides]|uniref:Uncharacterized protein n=1 Tax=Cordylochernes scorpioides TaxID=51811 RepID=A0ABY6LTN0_9ARAC|nr:hypothetical protein LAZ67_22001186 [Cordylochernes scorpioides]